MMGPNGNCVGNEVNVDQNDNCKNDLSRSVADIVHEYDDALELTGTGWYNRGLLVTLSIGLLGMAIDIFGFSIIVTGCACDFHVNIRERGIMMSMPFIGPILMAIVWGYISDTQGRKTTLVLALWGSFLSSFFSAFSYNWVMLAVLKFFSTCFCSAVQSGAYALLSESCASAVRGFYIIIMTSVLMLFLLSYVVPGYFILNFNFAINLGLITFTPWRLLTIIMALPLGISAFLLHFYYESPKFLINAGNESQALEYLTRIFVRNGGKADDYPVRRLVLNEDIKRKETNHHIIRSLWEHTIPLFQPPLFWTTCQLFFLTTAIYSINHVLLMWFPRIMETFTAGIKSAEDEDSRSLCSIIISTGSSSDDTTIICLSTIEFRTLLSGVTFSLLLAGTTLAVSKLGSKKKALTIAFLFIPLLSSVGAVFNQNNVASLLLFVGMMMTNLCMGPLFAYYVELYPTSYCGMAACLGVMMARVSALGGVNVLGAYVMTHCSMTFYAFSGYLLCGILVAAFFLPPDTPIKSVQ